MVLTLPTAPEGAREVTPAAVAAVRRSGRRPYRLLMFGGGALHGLGVRDHDMSLPGHLADALLARSGRGVDLDVIVDADATSVKARQLLRGLRLRRYDAVVVVLGEYRALAARGDDVWRKRVARLMRVLQDETAVGAAVLLCDSAEAMRRTSRIGAISRRVRARSERLSAVTSAVSDDFGVSFLELAPYGRDRASGGRFSSIAYIMWADLIASRMYQKLLALNDRRSADTPGAFRTRADPERPRQAALAQMRLSSELRNPLLDLITHQARLAFGATVAYLNIIDGDSQWTLSSSSGASPVIPREISVCDHTIRTDGLTLVNDAHRDPRFHDNPLTQGDDGMRFYAGFPVHSWDGYRVGSLCIMDRAPRNMLPMELRLLQDFVGRIEQELWASALHEAGRAKRVDEGIRFLTRAAGASGRPQSSRRG